MNSLVDHLNFFILFLRLDLLLGRLLRLLATDFLILCLLAVSQPLSHMLNVNN